MYVNHFIDNGTRKFFRPFIFDAPNPAVQKFRLPKLLQNTGYPYIPSLLETLLLFPPQWIEETHKEDKP